MSFREKASIQKIHIKHINTELGSVVKRTVKTGLPVNVLGIYS